MNNEKEILDSVIKLNSMVEDLIAVVFDINERVEALEEK